MAVTRTDRNQTFDHEGNLISEEIVETDITAQVVEYTLHDAVRTARQTIRDIRTSPAPSFTNVAEARTQVGVLQNQVKDLALVVLHLGRIVLADLDDTQ